MRKQIFGRQFKRDINERKALFKGLASSLVLHERITTTEEKAKAIKGEVEKLVTTAKKGDRHARALLQPKLNALAVKKILEDIGPRNASRPGGYTRIIKLQNRFGDNASQVILEWVEKKQITVTEIKDKKKATKETKSKVVKEEKKEATAKVATAKKTEKKVTKKGKTK